MDDLGESIRRCLFVLKSIAEYRKEEKSNLVEKKYINLGDKDLVHNFIALIFMGRKDYLFGDYSENSWAIFVPSIQYAIDLINDKDIINEKDNKLRLALSSYNMLKDKNIVRWLEKDDMPIKKIVKLVESLYPLKEDDKDRVNIVKMTVRVGSCMLTHCKTKMPTSDIKKCFRVMPKWKLNNSVLKKLKSTDNILAFNKNNFTFAGL